MQDLLIRKATPAGKPTLLQFEQGVIATERPFDPTVKPDPINYYNLEELLTAPHIYCVVAEIDGEVVGCGYARLEYAKHYIKHLQFAYLGFMYVLPKYRGQGINSKVLAALEGWAKSQNVTEFRLEVYQDNLPAIKAYEKVGYSRLMIQMRKGE